MKLATLAGAGRDGALCIVSHDLERAASAADIAPTLQAAIDQWHDAEPRLRARAEQLDAGTLSTEIIDFAGANWLAPLPRAWQWLDGSVYSNHGDLMQRGMGLPPNPKGRILMYQGISDTILAPTADVPFPSEDHGIDFEGEFGVIVDAVPMGTPAADAGRHIKLVVQINDWSLRALGKIEMQSGFGFIHAKPPISMAPVAVTPQGLGSAWRDGRVDLPLQIDWNGERFGAAEGYPMDSDFCELIAHAAHTRALCAGTLIGSGTISNRNYAEVGSSCIAERRAIETIADGKPTTQFMRYGDRVRMEVRGRDGAPVFGVIDQRVVKP